MLLLSHNCNTVASSSGIQHSSQKGSILVCCLGADCRELHFCLLEGRKHVISKATALCAICARYLPNQNDSARQPLRPTSSRVGYQLLVQCTKRIPSWQPTAAHVATSTNLHGASKSARWRVCVPPAVSKLQMPAEGDSSARLSFSALLSQRSTAR